VELSQSLRDCSSLPDDDTESNAATPDDERGMKEADLRHEPVGFMSNMLKDIDPLHPSNRCHAMLAMQSSMFHGDP
jgi:hypothetical protein